jgi:FAD/FMN-containing dehydrogenase
LITSPAFDALHQSLRGRVLLPDDPEFDTARSVWNGMIDRRPAVVAQCLGAADVMAAVDLAREHQLPVSVRGGGHSVAGNSVCAGGMMIDLSVMRGVRVDPQAQTARVEPGAQLGDLDAQAQAFGLAVPAGVDSRTGVAGLTLGGGQGYLMRRFGLTIDNLLSADVVTANGKLLCASQKQHPELFWALRGGGGNFGVVTSFEFRLHEVGPQVMTVQIFHAAAEAVPVLRCYRDFMASAPDAVAVYALCVHVPPISAFPETQHGKTSIALIGCYAGAIEDGRRALAPLTEFGNPLSAVLEPMPYRLLQSSFDAGAPNGARYYWKAHYLSDLTDDVIDVLAARSGSLPGPYSNFFLEPLGGAMGRIAPDATAFPHRAARYSFGISSGWANAQDDDAAIAWTREFHDAVTPHATGGVYANYLDRDDGHRLESAYGDNYRRLQRVKAEYDPYNLFRIDQSNRPATR